MKVGDKFQHNGDTVMVVEQTDYQTECCEYCYFFRLQHRKGFVQTWTCTTTISCAGLDRSDGKDVYFKKVKII